MTENPPTLDDAAKFDEILAAIDISQSSNSRFNPVKKFLGSRLGIDPDDIYPVGSGVRASNLPIRFVQGRAKNRTFPLAIGFLGPQIADDHKQVELAVRHARSAAANSHEVVGIGRPDNGIWTVTDVSGPENKVVDGLRKLFPDIRLHEPLSDESHEAEEGEENLSEANPIEELTFELLQQEMKKRALSFSEDLLRTALAIVRSGKHLLLVGDPGTGKTSFAEALATAATTARVTSGYLSTTATADWTSADTTGTYRLVKDGTLEFSPGLALQAIESQRWLLVDELNRADIDKAIGQLFTVMSNKSVTLPFTVAHEGKEVNVSVVPPEQPIPAGTYPYQISDNWRMIATMNVHDVDLLFDVSDALLRRFGVIELGVPSLTDYKDLLSTAGSTGRPALDRALGDLIALPNIALGPAILLDGLRIAREYVDLCREDGQEVDDREVLWAAFYAVVFPQMTHLDAAQSAQAINFVENLLAEDPVGDDEDFVRPLDGDSEE